LKPPTQQNISWNSKKQEDHYTGKKKYVNIKSSSHFYDLEQLLLFDVHLFLYPKQKLKCLKKPLKKQTFQYLEYVDRNRDNEQSKKEKKRVKEENPSSLSDS
jgi:hypothetical protein